jgi:uncharacterized membrane protein
MSRIVGGSICLQRRRFSMQDDNKRRYWYWIVVSFVFGFIFGGLTVGMILITQRILLDAG